MNSPMWKHFLDTYQKIQWKTHLLDTQWPSLEVLQLAREIENQFYWKRFLRQFHFPWGKTFFYQRKRKKRPQDCSPLLRWDNLRIDMIGTYAPGNILSQTEIIGYFQDISSLYPPNIGSSPSPLLPLWKTIITTLKDMINSFQQAQYLPPWFQNFSHLSSDFFACFDLAVYITQLWKYATKNKITFLSSGQIFWWCEQSYLLGLNIHTILAKEGLLAITLENQKTLYATFQTWLEKMQEMRLRLLIDMYQPLFSDEKLSIKLSEGKIVIDDLSPLPKTWLSHFIDRLFPQKEIHHIPTFKHTPSSFLPEPTQKPLQEAIQEVINRPLSEELDWSNVIIDAKDFLALRQRLKDFLTMMVSDLSPRYNSQGQILESKHLFDQFDVPPLMRRLERNRFILKGKLKGLSPIELQEKDDLVIKSTHWLYDRIQDIIDRYSFSAVGVRGEQAKQFAEDVQSLFTSNSDEYNEIRKYGTFTQFRFNIKRIFSSLSIQTRYLNVIAQIEQLLVKIKERIATEEIKLLRASATPKNSISS